MEADIPVYVRVQREVLDLLKSDEYKPGSKIPSERELSERFGASRMTTRKAVDKLVDEGTLERRGTSGTYLPKQLLARPLSRKATSGFSQMAHEHGRTSGSKLLFFERCRADEETVGQLGVALGEPIIEIHRQRTLNDIPVCIELSKIPAEFVPGLTAADVVQNASLYQLFHERYSVKLYPGDADISVCELTEQEADLLDLPPNSPVLEFRAVVHQENGKPFEFVRSINHPKLVTFHISGTQSGSKDTIDFGLVDQSGQ